MDKTQGLFSVKRKPAVSLYDNLHRTKNYLGLTSRGGDYEDLSTFYNTSYLDPYFKKPGTNNSRAVKLSTVLYGTNRIYQNLLDYLSNMYYWRYVVVPRSIKNKNTNMVKTSSYRDIYNKMVEIVEGLKIESTFPKLLLNIFKNGQIYIYTTGDKSSKTISTILLPLEYCRPTIMTQYGTTQIEFNFKFFDGITNNQDKLSQLFSIFPPEFKDLYYIYKKNSSLYPDGYLPLNPKVSTCISMNEIGFPTFLSVFYDLIDYKNYKLNEMDKNTNGLEKLVIQEINPTDTEMDLAEIEALHSSMAPDINQNGAILITSPGKVKVEQLQEEGSRENKVLLNAYKTIFDNAGFNNELFSGDAEESLNASLKRDLSFVWGYIEQLVNFYNLAINNIFNFKEYQASFRVLPISSYNESEKMEFYHQNATIGIGVLDAIVATGIKQVDLESTLDLEQFLDLRNRLMPLQSSHTQSSSTTSENESDDNDGNNPSSTNDENNHDEPSQSNVDKE